jgi:hypothetical protein
VADSPLILNGAAPRVPTLYDAVGRPIPVTDDPAWQPPADPLSKVDPQERARALSREVPLVVVATGWDVPSARRAMDDLTIGLFDAPSQVADAIMRSDSRTQAGLASRLSILGRPVDFRLPRKYRDSSLARECLDAFVDAWPEMAPEPAMGELQRWAIMMGEGPAQLLWRFGEYAVPKPLPWHMRYTYWHWQYRCLVAITMDGQEPIVPGDGHWMLHAPHGVDDSGYRGWMRGALGAVTPWWLARHYALRDWARFSEKHGLPIFKCKTPAVGDPYQQNAFRGSLQRMGQEGVIHLPQNPPPALSYDVEMMEASDTEHEGFRMLIEQCNSEITLALLAQTLTTSMPAEGGSSYAAARVHAGVLQGLLEADARALAGTMYRDLARPFAALNFGNADLAPRVIWDVTPFEDAETKAKSFQALAGALNSMRTAGFKLDPKAVRKMIRDTIPGFDPGKIEEVQPVQIEAQAARAGQTVGGSPGSPSGPPKGEGLARMGKLMAGARFDPRVLERVPVTDEMREAMAYIDQAHRRAA